MELRQLQYFTAVVQWKGYREASRRLYITHPSISEAVSSLESELGIKLFSRDGHVARLTPEGQVFYEEPIKTLAQAERSIAIAQRAAKGEIGRLGIGFIGFASGSFLPESAQLQSSLSRSGGQDLAVSQKKELSIALKSFLELLEEQLPAIRKKTRYP